MGLGQWGMVGVKGGSRNANIQSIFYIWHSYIYIYLAEAVVIMPAKLYLGLFYFGSGTFWEWLVCEI